MTLAGPKSASNRPALNRPPGRGTPSRAAAPAPFTSSASPSSNRAVSILDALDLPPSSPRSAGSGASVHALSTSAQAPGARSAAAPSPPRLAPVAANFVAHPQGFWSRLWAGLNHVVAVIFEFCLTHFFKRSSTPATTNPNRLGPADINAILAHAQPGDIILWGDQTSLIHASIYMGNGEVIQALATDTAPGVPEGVVRENIADYNARVDHERVIILRRRNANPAAVAAELAYAQRQLGKDYDFLFRTEGSDSFYCTKLVWAALEQGPDPLRITPHPILGGLYNVLTDDDLRQSPDLVQVWAKNAPAIGVLTDTPVSWIK